MLWIATTHTLNYENLRSEKTGSNQDQLSERCTMLLQSYRLEIFNNKCKPDALTVQCHAHLDQDISQALPYVNSVLGGNEYIVDPPSVTFKLHGKLISVQARRIAINAMQDAAEAKKIVEWLKEEINAAWKRRDEIEPRYRGSPRIQMVELLKLLPKTNCGECGAPTCMVFATQVMEGAKDSSHCPGLEDIDRNRLDGYLSQFNLTC